MRKCEYRNCNKDLNGKSGPGRNRKFCDDNCKRMESYHKEKVGITREACNVLIGVGALSKFSNCVVIGEGESTKDNQLIILSNEVSVSRDIANDEFTEILSLFRTIALGFK